MACLTGALLFLLVASICRLTRVQGLTISMEGVRRTNGAWAGHQSLMNAGALDILSSADLEWFTVVTLGGNDYRVLVDSGSADLWVAGAAQSSTDTGMSGSIEYADGTTAAGSIRTATLRFPDGVRVHNQAYVQQQVDSDHPSSHGLLGIGPRELSFIQSVLDGPAGTPPLTNLLDQDDSTRYMTLLLDRTGNMSQQVTGRLTIGEMQDGLKHVGDMPEVAVDTSAPGGHWMVPLDLGGILGPSGEVIKATQETPLKVIFNAGYTLSRVPAPITDAIYSGVPGAKFTSVADVVDPVWVLPCHVELNITFKIGGVSYPIHPLDTVISDIRGPPDVAGQPTCIGAFQPLASSDQPTVLGAFFLRNVYFLVAFGDFAGGPSAEAHDPFIQLLPTTEPAQAHAEFVQRRLNRASTTSVPDVGGASAPGIKRDLPWIIAGGIVGLLVLVFCVTAAFIYWRGRRYRALRGSEEVLDTWDDALFVVPDDYALPQASEEPPAAERDPMARTKYRQAMKRFTEALTPIRRRSFLSVLSRRSDAQEEKASLISNAAPPAISPPPTPPPVPPVPAPYKSATSVVSTPSPLSAAPGSDEPAAAPVRSSSPTPPSSSVPEAVLAPPPKRTSLSPSSPSLPLASVRQSAHRPLPVPPIGAGLPKPSLRVNTGSHASDDCLNDLENPLPNPYDLSMEAGHDQPAADITVDHRADARNPSPPSEARVHSIPRRPGSGTIRPLPDPHA